MSSYLLLPSLQTSLHRHSEEKIKTTLIEMVSKSKFRQIWSSFIFDLLAVLPAPGVQSVVVHQRSFGKSEPSHELSRGR
jgi:hypothetical protein